LTPEKILHLAEYATSGHFTAQERLALALTDAMSASPVTVPPALFAELQAAFTPAQLVELASAIAWENYRGRFNRVFDVQPEGFSEGAACALPARLPLSEGTPRAP
jgi:alkylhydroperoxidase family enzyme